MQKLGPMTTDADFFDSLDYSIEGTEKLYQLVKSGNYAEAREEFTSFIKGYLDPDKYFSLPGKEKKPIMTETLFATAKRALAHEMKSVGVTLRFEGEVDWTANPTYNKYSEWTWQLSRHSEIIALADAYRSSGDEKYAEGAVQLLRGWIRQALPPELTERGGATLAWRTIECGIRMFNWPKIILSLIHSPHFTSDFCVDVFKSLNEHAVQLMHRFTTGNWLLMELNGLIHVALVYPVFRDRGIWLKTVTERALKEIDLQVHPDGMQYEITTGYQGVVISNFMQLYEVALRYGEPLPTLFLDKLEKLVEVYVKLMMTDGRLPNVNDGNHSFAKEHIKKYVHHYPNNETFKWVLTDGKEGVAPDYDSCLLKYSGLCVMRSGWTSDSVSVLFDAGKYGKAHQHEDKLNVTLCNGEKTVLCEAQIYAYDTSDMRKYVLSSFGHNTVTVNGNGQNRRAGYKWHPEMIDTVEDIDYLFTDSVDYARGSYSEKYGEKTPATHQRSVVLLKATKCGKPILAVVDRLTPKDSEQNDYQAIWHFDTEALTLTDYGAKCDELTVFTFGEDKKTVVKGVNLPQVQGYICRSSLQGSEEPIPTLLLDAKGKEVTLAALFSLNEEGTCPIKEVQFENGVFTVNYQNGKTDFIDVEKLHKTSKNAKEQ